MSRVECERYFKTFREKNTVNLCNCLMVKCSKSGSNKGVNSLIKSPVSRQDMLGTRMKRLILCIGKHMEYVWFM